MKARIFKATWENGLDFKIYKSFPGRNPLFGLIYNKDGNDLYFKMDVTPEEATYLCLTFGAAESKSEIVTAFLTPYNVAIQE